MAGFCTKCGATLSSGTGFCSSCGAPVAAAAIPPQPVPTTPPAYPQQAAPGYPPANPSAPPAGYPPQAGYPTQPQKSSGALKIVLIVIAVFVGLGVIAAGVVGYGIYKVKQAVHLDNSGNATLSALGANISAGKNVNVSEADLGVPFYPGATRGEGGLHMSLPTGSVDTAVLTTDDPVSAVTAFYKGKLGENESDINSDTGTVLTSGKQGANGKSGTMITIGPGSGDKSGKTQITITHTVSTQ